MNKINLVLIGVSILIIVTGLFLMAGDPSGATEYNPDIYSFRRITVGPMVSFAGFILMIVAILFPPKKTKTESGERELSANTPSSKVKKVIK